MYRTDIKGGAAGPESSPNNGRRAGSHEVLVTRAVKSALSLPLWVYVSYRGDCAIVSSICLLILRGISDTVSYVKEPGTVGLEKT